jgi:oxepin-CoA hydrolase/3-oxo-5,6-dehydrosuberyl-CoA semialdehyde dehydrogenase
MKPIPSFACGEWYTSSKSTREIANATTGEVLYSASSQGLSFAEMLAWGREKGGPALRAMTFHERARMLKALAQHLNENKRELYRLSTFSGATKRDAWVDVDGGIGTFFTYASKGRRELPDQRFLPEGDVERLSKENTFVGQHICVPLEGVALHINAFNFPCWGMLEKLAPTILAGMPAIVKPATSTSYIAQACMKEILASNILPEGALQMICGSTGDIFEHLSCQDVVTFTGSKDTAISLRSHPRLLDQSVRFNQETDSLNCSVLAPDVSTSSPEFGLFVKELVREMTVKAGQKCTVIRRAIVPRHLEEEVIDTVRQCLSKIKVGDPALEQVGMGPLVSIAQRDDVAKQIKELSKWTKVVIRDDELIPLGADHDKGAFLSPTLLHCEDPLNSPGVHEIEPFGPVCTLMSYESTSEAIDIARKGGGSLVASIFSGDDSVAKELCLGLAPYHGRILLADDYCAKESTGHGSPLPHLTHGGPGRAGGGEELGGIRAVLHYMQRTALQGSPQRLSYTCNKWLPGADYREDQIHPFRKYFDEIRIGESLLSHRRTVTEADIVNFAGLSGDHFYAHVDDIAAKESLFGARVAHGYLVLAIAAGLFVDPAPGPVLANYGLENLRFIKPVFIGDTLRVRLTCEEKTPKDLEPQGVVSWYVEVINQIDEAVATYSILTLVVRRTEEAH